MVSNRNKTEELFEIYAQTKQVAIRNEIVLLNKQLVSKIAHKFCYKDEYADIYQIGIMGLLQAVEQFDFTRNIKFSCYAVPYVSGAIQHYLRDKSAKIRIPRKFLKINKEASLFRTKYFLKNREQPSDIQIASVIGISISEWRECLIAIKSQSFLSLDYPALDNEECLSSLDNVLNDKSIEFKQTNQEDFSELEDIVSKLDFSLSQIVNMIYLKQMSRKEVAKKIGCTPMTVSRRLDVAITQLKDLYRQVNVCDASFNN